MQEVQDIYELSPMQHGMLFDSVTVGDSGMYLIQLEYFLTGSLREEEFVQAWQRTLDRHAILRTSFHWDDLEKPLQVVHREVAAAVPSEDLRELPAEEQDRALTEARESDRSAGVDFGAAPLMRLQLFRTADDRYRLLWSFHHILMEGWSASLILREVLAHYRGITRGETVELAEHRPYRDYVTWFQGQDPKRAEAYWRETLAGIDHPTHMGIDLSPTKLHAPVTEYDGIAVNLSEADTARLQAFVKQHGLTLNTLVQGAWAVLLSRYCGEDDVVFGTIVSGRSVPLDGVDTMIGLFVNLLPARAGVPSDAELLPWLKDLQARQARQREFEYCSLVNVKGWSDIPAGLPLFESLLVFENWHGDLTVSDWDADLSVSDVHGHHGSPGYPLTAIVAPGPELTIGISYDSTRFVPDAIRRVLANLQNLLLGMVDGPGARLGSLPLLDADEREQVLRGWNDTAGDAPGDPAHAQFERQVDRTPDATALAWRDEALSYRELDERANQLARALAADGIGPGARVALCTDREPHMVVGVLGILKAGAAYVPLDPMQPTERLASLLSDARVSALLTQQRLSDRFTSGDGAPKLIRLDADWPTIAGQPTGRPSVAVAPDAVAYMIYTSGSTGRPKGVMVPHRALTNYVEHAVDAFGMTAADRMLQFASISFDTAAEEIFPTLSVGATLVLRTDEMIASVEAFLTACTAQLITIIDFPTAYWHVVVGGLADAGVPFPPTVRLAILGGERARPEPLAEWFARVGSGVRVLNTYGPTEATIVATMSELRPDTEGVPIGRPIRNARAYVLDPRGEPVPIGVPGELHLAGAGLAIGYFERPDLTEAAFVPDPFAPEPPAGEPGARMYRTGDVVRHRPDGTLDFLGRRDNQVKFRGYRIELGEIEAALGRCDGVKEAVVLLREDTPGNPRLVSYVVADPAPDAAELKRALSEHLPNYMVPSATVFLDALPVTPAGKVDHRALPEPDRAAPAEPEDDERSPTEETLAGIWCKVLDLERVGSHDNFFDLGGHSLLLMQVIGEVKKAFGIQLDPGELVLPTLRQLATLCDEKIAAPAPEEKPAGLMGKLAKVFRSPGGSPGKPS
ncbi:MAG: amino acid adenylation domain-containing protein [Planctomycetota bacterium]|jgi:amino acid adenylation domain-containing protein